MSMAGRVTELELPLGTGLGELAERRLEHLRGQFGEEPAAAVRLVTAFRSLAAIYSASEADLAAVVGRIAAARMRWFLDAPLGTALDLDLRPSLADAA